MSVPLNVTHDPIAQATRGLVGKDVNNPQINALALVTLGFLWGDFWVSCYDAVSTSWSDCFASVLTSWDDCYDDVVTSWDPCSEFD